MIFIFMVVILVLIGIVGALSTKPDEEETDSPRIVIGRRVDGPLSRSSESQDHRDTPSARRTSRRSR